MNPENRWVKKAETIPWDAIEEKYAKRIVLSRNKHHFVYSLRSQQFAAARSFCGLKLQTVLCCKLIGSYLFSNDPATFFIKGDAV